MVNNAPKIQRMGYISNHPPLLSIEKPFSKTHAPEIRIGMLEKFLGFLSVPLSQPLGMGRGTLVKLIELSS
jgi:hypothetical protein